MPPVALNGDTRTNSTVFPLPNVGLVYRPDDSRLAYGLLVNAVAGFGVDYPGSATNPILTARPPAGVGVGPVYSDYQVLQVSPTVAYQLTDRLSVAGGPNINLGRLQFAPGLFVPPDDANGDGFATYPPATHTRWSWGGGFTVGLYYKADTWAAGVSYKSPQWFEPFRYNTTDELGRPRGAAVNLDLPQVVSVGGAYTGFERWVLAADLRYLGYGQARGYGDAGFLPTGAAAGLGFQDMFAVAVGAEYRVTDRLTARCGYSYGTNPIPDAQAAVNVASPTIFEHIITAGASWAVTDDFSLSVGYLHGFDRSISGPLRTAAGTVPGVTVRSSAVFDAITFGASVKFGSLPGRCSGSPVAGASAVTEYLTPAAGASDPTVR